MPVGRLTLVHWRQVALTASPSAPAGRVSVTSRTMKKSQPGIYKLQHIRKAVCPELSPLFHRSVKANVCSSCATRAGRWQFCMLQCLGTLRNPPNPPVSKVVAGPGLGFFPHKVRAHHCTGGLWLAGLNVLSPYRLHAQQLGTCFARRLCTRPIQSVSAGGGFHAATEPSALQPYRVGEFSCTRGRVGSSREAVTPAYPSPRPVPRGVRRAAARRALGRLGVRPPARGPGLPRLSPCGTCAHRLAHTGSVVWTRRRRQNCGVTHG